jgi:vancomycin resistance protein YoaR
MPSTGRYPARLVRAVAQVTMTQPRDLKLVSLYRSAARRWWVVGVLALLGVGMVAFASGQHRVSRGISIGDVALDGLAWQDVRRVLSDYMNRRRHQPLAFTGDAGICTATLDNLGATLELAETETRLRQLARDHRGIRGWTKSRVELRPTVVLDPAKLATWLSDCENGAIGHRPIEGRLIAKDADFVIQPSQAGRRVDAGRMAMLIGQAVSRSDDAAINLPIVDQPELPLRSALERARAVALEITSKAVVLFAEPSQSRLTLLRVDLAKMIEHQTEPSGEVQWHLSRPAFDQWLASRRHRVEQRARDATYEVKGRDQLVTVPEQKGSRISVDRLFADLESGLRNGLRQLAISFEPTELPKRTVADLDQLKIRDPLGTFTTRHACCQPRVNNIHRIADIVNGTIVPAGQTFSLNELVGQRSLENGFVPAPSIEDGEMVDTIGGGISQFATTFYNAVMRAGYEVLERQAHTYWFDRYPMGHEATLSWPKPDIVIRNDSESGLLILASYTDRSITLRLFGGRDGRRVDVSVSPRFDIVRPPIEYLPNAELEPDKEHVKDGGCIGWSVWTMRTVTLRDGTQKQDKRKVVYKPRIRRVEVHPCKIPKGEPGHTGEKCPEPSPATDTESDQANGNPVSE